MFVSSTLQVLESAIKRNIHSMSNKSAIILLLLLMLSSCNEESVFTAEVKEIAQPEEIVDMTVDKIETDYMYSQFFAVYDTLLISSCPNSTDYKFYISNLKRNQLLGSFMRYGQGPDDHLMLAPVKRIEIEGDNLIALTYDPNKKQLLEWNITQSIENGRDSILRPGYYQNPNDVGLTYSRLYRLGKSKYFGFTPEFSAGESLLLPSYWFIDEPDVEPTRSISIVKEVIPNPDSHVADFNFFSSPGSLRPDNTKNVDVMCYLDQINIVDLQNDSVFSYRIKGSQDEGVFRTATGPTVYRYHDVVCNNTTIYALYCGEPTAATKNLHGCYWVHEFDWDGNFKTKYRLPIPIMRLWLDTSNNTLYGYNLEEDSLYRLNV